MPEYTTATRVPGSGAPGRVRRFSQAFQVPGGGVESIKVLNFGDFDDINTNTTIVSPEQTLFVTTGNTSRTITLPVANEYANARIFVKKVDSGTGTVVIDGAGAETIDGVNTYTIYADGGAVEIISDGTSWFVTSEFSLVYSSPNALKEVVNQNYTITAPTQSIFVTVGAGNRTITMPDVSLYRGVVVTVKRKDAGANSLTIATPGAETIDGAATQSLPNRHDSYAMISDGSNWFIVGSVP